MANLEAANLFNVKGMVFVVTGGGSGIGKMMAEALDINGAAKVYIIGRRKVLLEEVANGARNKSIVAIQGDATSQESLSEIVAHVASEVEFVNAVIANHGIMGPTLDELPKNPSLKDFHAFLWKTPMEAFTQTYNTNTSGIFYTFLAFLSLLDEGNKNKKSPTVLTGVKSQFIATTSIGAFSRRPSAGFAYAGSKAAVNHMMKQCATCFAPYHIRANVIAPGVYPSDMSNVVITGRKRDGFQADKIQNFLAGSDATKEGSVHPTLIPATRTGTEEDIAGATLFLCSRAGAYLNGNIIITDGGRLAVVPGTY